MGCWSESCAISGMEIRAGSEIYAMTWKVMYGELRINVPPVAGTYDDYGGIDLTEDLPEFGFKKGENWRPVEDDRGTHMFIDAAVFEFLRSLEPEFTYGDLPKTIDGVWLAHRKNIVEHLIKWIDIRDSSKSEEDKGFDRLMMATKFGAFSHDRFMNHVSNIFEDAVSAGGSIETLTPLINAYGRAVIVDRSFSELRKQPSPGSVNAPQHGGEQALIPFYDFVLHLAKKRRDEDREEAWNLEELNIEYPLSDWQKAVAEGETRLSFRDWQVEQEEKE